MKQPFYQHDVPAVMAAIDIEDHREHTAESSRVDLVRKCAAFYRMLSAEMARGSPIFMPSEEWADYNRERDFFYDMLRTDACDAAAQVLLNFWRNTLGLIVKEYAKYEDLANKRPDTAEYFKSSMVRNYLIWKDLFHLPATRLAMDTYIGNPWGCRIENVLVAPKAIRYHTNAMQIQGILSDRSSPFIIEIGGGYGGLPYFLFKEIPHAKYANFDLPETLVIHAYYVSQMMPNKKVFLFGDEPFTTDSLSEYDIFLLPACFIENFPGKSADIAFNSFSFSEMNPESVDAYLSNIRRICSGYFLHNNMDRKGVVNRGHERIPSSLFNVEKHGMKLLSKNYDVFHSHFGDYKEFVYQMC